MAEMVVDLFFRIKPAEYGRVLTHRSADHPLPRGLPEKLVFTVHGVSHLVP